MSSSRQRIDLMISIEGGRGGGEAESGSLLVIMKISSLIIIVNIIDIGNITPAQLYYQM